jgi:hypothetical protein
MEIIHRRTTLPRLGRLARGLFAARACRGHESVGERDVCEIGAGPNWTSCAGAEVKAVTPEVTTLERN